MHFCFRCLSCFILPSFFPERLLLLSRVCENSRQCPQVDVMCFRLQPSYFSSSPLVHQSSAGTCLLLSWGLGPSDLLYIYIFFKLKNIYLFGRARP